MFTLNTVIFSTLSCLAFGIFIGLAIGWNANWSAYKLFSPGRSEAEELWAALEDEHVDLDVCSGRDSENPRWVCYHPTKYSDYNMHGFPTAQEALKDYLRRAVPSKKKEKTPTPTLRNQEFLGANTG